MTILINNIRRITKDKMALVGMLIWPLVLMLFVSFRLSNVKASNIGFIDEDNTKVTGIIKEKLGELSKVAVYNVKEEDIKEKLINEDLDYIIHLEKGYTDKLFKGENPVINSYSISETNTQIPIKIFIENYGNIINNMSYTSEGDESKFYEGLKSYEEGILKVSDKLINENSENNAMILQVIGFLVMGVLSLGIMGCSFIVEDRAKNMYGRIFTSPITIKSYMFQNILSGILITFVQITILMGCLKFMLKVDLSYEFLQLYLIMLLFGLVSVSLGTFINSIAKSTRQFSLIGSLILTPFCMLGGCFWPREIMPKVLRNISNFVPTTWAIEASKKVLFGDNIVNLTYEIGIMLLFTLVFFLLSSWKTVEINK
ncbi:ABC transporter permease [Clostridium amazonitimonense]|uniref:ABC transporter permease n=1 Tax=Clostridium amazonitimonense TaxID=1499689 RepID=UPI0005099FD6|nr:ABC transporter permease [Clostridium amazonitimonense]